MWQARKLSPAAHLHRGEIDLSLLGSEQASANPVCMLARANGCLCAYVQWWCIVLLSQSIWQVTAIRPTSHSETPVHRQRGKLWVSFQACERTTSPKSAHIDHIQACLHSCKASPLASPRDGFVGQRSARFGRFGRNSSRPLLLSLFSLFSSSFHPLTGCPVLQMRGRASAGRNGGRALSVCVHVWLHVLFVYLLSSACQSFCRCNQAFPHVCVSRRG